MDFIGEDGYEVKFVDATVINSPVDESRELGGARR